LRRRRERRKILGKLWSTGSFDKEKLFAVMMVQMPFDQSGYYRSALREQVYAALLH